MPIELAKLLLWGTDGTTRVTTLTLSLLYSAPPTPAIHILGYLSPHSTLGDKGKDAKALKETTFLAGVNFPAPAALSLSWAGTHTSGVLVPTLADLEQAPRPLVLRVPLWEIKAKSLPRPSPRIPG